MGEYNRLSVADALKLIEEKQAAVADIRDARSFAAGHVPGAFNLNDSNLNQFMLENDPDGPVLVFCYHGVSSQGAGQYLANQGFDEVYSVDGGMTAWAHQYPDKVERSA